MKLKPILFFITIALAVLILQEVIQNNRDAIHKVCKLYSILQALNFT